MFLQPVPKRRQRPKPPVVGKQLLTPANLELVGGFRIDSWVNNDPFIGTTGYSWGGATVAMRGSDVYCWCLNNENNKYVIENTRSLASMGSPAASPSTWPIMSRGTAFSRGSMFVQTGMDGYHLPNGMVFDTDADRLYVSVYSRYDTTADPVQWLAAVDYPSKTTDPTFKPVLADSQMASFGGGLTLVDQEWADAHSNGERLALSKGALTSGQGGSYGPTLAFLNGNSSALKRVMYFATNAETGQDIADGEPYTTKIKCERGFDDYTDNISWIFSPDEDGGFFTGEIRGCPAWIDHPNYKGLIVVNRACTGFMSYAYQTEGGSQTWKPAWRTYDPDLLGQAADGLIDPWMPKAVHLESWQGPIGGMMRSVTWDKINNYLWIFYSRVWSSGVEKHPAIAAYRIVN